MDGEAPARLLIACIGNIFLGDDAFGVEVARRLLSRGLPREVRVVDFGIRGMDLTYALLEHWHAVILVDAAPRGGTPGDLYVIEPELANDKTPEPMGPMIDLHTLDPEKVLRLVRSLGGSIERFIVIGCEPSPLGEDDGFGTELSPPVRAAVDEAIPMIERWTEKLLAGESTTCTNCR